MLSETCYIFSFQGKYNNADGFEVIQLQCIKQQNKVAEISFTNQQKIASSL